MNQFRTARAAVLFLLVFICASAWAAPVLMISIDGLKPEYVTHADEHGLHIPTLRRFVQEGTYAEGVIPSLPKITEVVEFIRYQGNMPPAWLQPSPANV